MSTGRKATTAAGLVCAAALCSGLLAASGATIRWHILTNDLPPVFGLYPPYPTTTNGINFVAPTDGRIYINSCFASVSNGTPTITVDVTNREIQVSFSTPWDGSCPLDVLPVSGVDGQLGLLRAGTWAINIHQNSYTFNVAEAPLRLSIQALTNASSFQLSWPVSGDAFVLESNSGLSSGHWQVVTNPPMTVGNQNTVQIYGDSGNRFFRLRQLPP